MNRGTNPSKAPFSAHVTFFAAALGGGAATNGTIPSNGVLADDTATYPKPANFATSLTYVSTGLYTLLLSEQVKNLLYACAIVVDAGSAPTAVLCADVTKINSVTRTITVKISTPAGVLTDLGTSDLLIVKVDGADTSAP